MTKCRSTVLALVLLLGLGLTIRAGQPGTPMAGRLVDEDGTGRAGVTLVFHPENASIEAGGEFRTITGEDGGFSVDLPEGTYVAFEEAGSERIQVGMVKVPSEEMPLLRAVETNPSPDADLAVIRDYSVEGDSSEVQDLSDLVNPFPARKQGRVYGSVYLFHRNDNFDARNFFDPVGEPLPEYKRSQFGGTLSWFVTPKLSFQGTFDGLRINRGSTILSHVPTVSMKQGDFSASGISLIDPLTGQSFPGNRIPQERISPVAKQLLAVVPDPNRSDPDRNFVNNDPRVRDQDHYSIRGDYALKDNSNLTGEFYSTKEGDVRVQAFPTFNAFGQSDFKEASLAYNRSLNEKLIVYGRIEVGRNTVYSLSRNSGQSGLLSSLGISGLAVEDPIEEGYPYFDVTGYADFGDSNSPSTEVRNRINLDSSFTYVRNNHTFRGGFQLYSVQLNNSRSDGLHRGRFSFTGIYTGDGFADFLLGLADTASRGIGSDRADLRKQNWSAFARDQWRIIPNLDVSFGLRYEFSQPMHSNRDNVAGFYPLLFEPPLDGEIIIAGSPRADQLGFSDAVEGSLVFPDRNNWAPQLGLAFTPLGNNSLVIRSNYSINFDSPDDWYFIDSLTRNYPFYYVESVTSSGGISDVFLENPFQGPTRPELTIRGLEPKLQNSYVQFWRLAIENQIAQNWHVGVTYSGQKGTRMPRSIVGNVPLPGPGAIDERRPNPNYGRFRIVGNGGSYSGNSLDLTAERRLSGGVSLRSGFAWNRFFDDGIWSDPQNPRDLRAERATANWIAKQRVFLNYIVDLPLRRVPFLQDASGWMRFMVDGWRLSGITEIQAGRPFTVTQPGDLNNDGVYGDRPDRLASGELPSSEQSVDLWFDTSAFVESSLYGFGTAGRNILDGPGYQAWDVSVIKQSRFNDGDILELRVEFFNALNQVNFQRPDSQLGSSLFGKIYGADHAREIEVALKYSF